MALNLYKSDDKVYILANTTEEASEKYRISKSKDAKSISLFEASGSVIAATENSSLTVVSAVGGVSYPNTLTAQTFPVGALVQFNAVASPGYVFSAWKDGSGNTLSSSAQFNYTVTADNITIIPVFTLIPRVITTVDPTNGTSYPVYTSGQNFDKGDVIQFNAVADDGFAFVNWVDGDGNVLSTNAQYNLTVDNSLTIEAVFTGL